MDTTQSYTHQKRPYQAVCTQFTGSNFEDLIAIFSQREDEAAKFGAHCLMVRFKKCPPGSSQIETLTEGWWVVVGENGVLKCYDDATFRIKYEGIA